MWIVLNARLPYSDLGSEIGFLNPEAEIIPCASGNVLVISESEPKTPDGVEMRKL
jgi:hypothetical protein